MNKYMLRQLLKLLIRPFCHHTYYKEFKLYGRNIEHNKEVVFDIGYKCTKCDKCRVIVMDKEYQLGMKDNGLGMESVK